MAKLLIGKKITSLNPKLFKTGVNLKPAKLNDLNKQLFKHYMPHWREKEQLVKKKLFEQQEELQYPGGEVIDEDCDTGDKMEEASRVGV